MANIQRINGNLLNAATASLATTASYAVTAQNVLGSITSASYAATASVLLGSVVSASYAATASIASTASFLSGTASNASFATTASTIQSIRNSNNTTLYLTAIDSFNSVNTEEILYGVNITVNPANASITATSVTASFTGSLTGSLFGTASWTNNALRAVTASFLDVGTYAITASWAVSASQAITASRATSASFASNGGVTQIVAGTNVTISPTDGLGAVTINSTGGGAAFPFTGNAIITGSLLVSGSSAGLSGITGSLFGTASYALTASYFQGSDNLASVQARRTTGFTLPVTANFITLDATDIETTPAVVAHDNVNTERVYVYSTGLYLLHYHADVGPGTVSDFEFSIVKNALTTVSGSTISGKNSSTDKVAAGVDTLVLLSANDYVALYGRYVGSSGGIANNVLFSVT